MMILGSLVVITISWNIHVALQRTYTQEGSAEFERAYSLLEDKTRTYIYGLQGMAGVYIAADFSPTTQKLRRYAQFRDFFSNFSGLLGYGFIRSVKDTDLPSYVRRQRREHPGFHIHGIENHSYDRHMIVEAIEPSELNRSALGLDISTQEDRRQAALRAMRTGQASLTSSLHFINGQVGFLYLLPLYQVPYVPLDPPLREKQIIGWVYAPILTVALQKYLMNRTSPYLALDVYQKIGVVRQELFHYGLPARLRFHRELLIGGQTWQVEGSYEDASSLSLVQTVPWIFFFFLISIFLGVSFAIRRLLMARASL